MSHYIQLDMDMVLHDHVAITPSGEPEASAGQACPSRTADVTAHSAITSPFDFYDTSTLNLVRDRRICPFKRSGLAQNVGAQAGNACRVLRERQSRANLEAHCQTGGLFVPGATYEQANAYSDYRIDAMAEFDHGISPVCAAPRLAEGVNSFAATRDLY